MIRRRNTEPGPPKGDIDTHFTAGSCDLVGSVEALGDLAGAGFGDGQVAGQNGDELITAPAANVIMGAHLAAQAGR